MNTNLMAFNSTMNEAKDKVVDFAFDDGPKVLAAIVILITGFILARWLSKVAMKALDKKGFEPPVKMLISRILKLLVVGFAAIIALGTAGVDVVALVAGLSVAGLGVGLAMQGVLNNLVAGLTIIMTKPYLVGEYIEIEGVNGQVQTIELFSTTLLHPDLSRVVIPNRKIVGEIMHNYGKIRQLDLSVGVGYGSNIQEVLGLVQEIVAKNPRVLQNPAPALGISMLGDCSVNIAIRPWTNLDDFGPARAEIYQAVLDSFRAKNIEIPFPQREVRLLNGATA